MFFSAANWLKPQKFRSNTERFWPRWLSWQHFRNNWPYFAFLTLFFTINIVLFVEAAIRYRESSKERERGREMVIYCFYFLVFLVSIARGGGACLNFTPVVVIMLMYRQIITFLRSTRFSFLFPLDEYIKLHKIVGYTIVFFSIIHTLAHLANFSKLSY